MGVRGRPRRDDLSDRQLRVLELLAGGATNGEIAAALDITLDGAKYHVRELCSRFDVSTREELAEIWRRQNGFRARLGILNTPKSAGRWTKWALAGLAMATIAAIVLLAIPSGARVSEAAEVLYLAPQPSIDGDVLTQIGAVQVTTYADFEDQFDPSVTRVVMFDEREMEAFPDAKLQSLFDAGIMLIAVNVPPRSLRDAISLVPENVEDGRDIGGLVTFLDREPYDQPFLLHINRSPVGAECERSGGGFKHVDDPADMHLLVATVQSWLRRHQSGECSSSYEPPI